MNAKLGLIAYGLDRAQTGIPRYTKELIGALEQLGADTTILQAGKVPYGNRTIRLRASSLLPGLLTIGQIEVARIAHQQRLALVHDPTGCAPLWLTEAKRVVSIHDVIPYIYPKTSTQLDWLIYHFWLPLAARRVDAIITCSEQSRMDILRHLAVQPEQVFMIPLATNPAYRPIPPRQRDAILPSYGIQFPYILYVGSIEARKNLSRLLEAYAQVRAWASKWKLVIVGAHRRKYAPLFHMLEHLHLVSDVHFTGYVAEEDLPALYSGASVFVFPSLYEGFGLPVLEAMACGTPVITSNCSSLPEVAGEAALLVNPLDVNMIALAIRRVLADADFAAELRIKGLARAQDFSWEETAKQTVRVYERVLTKHTL